MSVNLKMEAGAPIFFQAALKKAYEAALLDLEEIEDEVKENTLLGKENKEMLFAHAIRKVITRGLHEDYLATVN